MDHLRYPNTTSDLNICFTEVVSHGMRAI